MKKADYLTNRTYYNQGGCIEMRVNYFLLLLFMALGVLSGCGGNGGGTPDGSVSVAISPTQVTLGLRGGCQFTAIVSGTSNTGVIWSVSPEGGGSVTATGLYTAPNVAGTYYVKATSKADPAKSDQATVIVTGGAVQSEYTGTITISNTGTVGGLTTNQSATLEVALGSPGAPFTHYDNSFSSALVSASINDTAGGDPLVTITGSLTSAVMNSPDLVVMLEIKETTYDLLIVGVPVECVFAGGGATFSAPYPVLGRVIEEYPLPTDKSRLTDNLTEPAAELPGVTQKIAWDLFLEE